MWKEITLKVLYQHLSGVIEGNQANSESAWPTPGITHRSSGILTQGLPLSHGCFVSGPLCEVHYGLPIHVEKSSTFMWSWIWVYTSKVVYINIYIYIKIIPYWRGMQILKLVLCTRCPIRGRTNYSRNRLQYNHSFFNLNNTRNHLRLSYMILKSIWKLVATPCLTHGNPRCQTTPQHSLVLLHASLSMTWCMSLHS